MMLALLLAVVGFAEPPSAAPPTPSYLVERVVTVGGESRRLSVFRDGTAVLVRRGDGRDPEILRRTVSTPELEAFARVVAECAGEMERVGVEDRGPGGGTVELRIAVPGKRPAAYRFPIAAVANLATGRLTAALDDLETALTRQRSERRELADWSPAVGDRLELEDGRTVTVLEVREVESGLLLRLQVGTGPLAFYSMAEEVRRMAVRMEAR